MIRDYLCRASVSTMNISKPISAVLALMLALLASSAPITVAEAQESMPVYRFGVPPWQVGQSTDDIVRLYRPMVEWLGQRIGARFVIVGARNYNEMVELMANESIQVASISPLPFVLAQSRNPRVRMLATELSWSVDGKKIDASYESFIVARRDRDDIDAVESLRGKRFGFVRAQSTSGYVYTMAYLMRSEIDYQEFFERAYFLGSHPRVTDAIAAGSIDAGATWDFNLRQAIRKHGPIFKILAVTGTIPNLGIAANGSLPPEVQVALQAALLDIDHSLLEGLPGAGYVVKDDAYYDPVREVLELVLSETRELAHAHE